MGVIHSRVAGVTFSNDDGSSRQEILSRMSKHRKLRFRDAATEDHPNAITVHNVKGEQLGFLPSEISEYIRGKEIDPSKLSGEVYSVGQNKERTYLGCLIDITHDSIENNAVGYQPRNYTGNQDWNSIREYTGKINITAEDVDAYNEAKANVLTPPVRSTVTIPIQDFDHERIAAEYREKTENRTVIICLIVGFVIIGTVLYWIAHLF